MKTLFRSLRWLSLLLLVVVYPHETAEAQEEIKAIRSQFSFYPGFRFCNPAEVKGVGFGNQPLDVMLAQIYIESRSEKVIAAVKISWKIYEFEVGMRLATSGKCEPPATPEAALSGGTEFIDLDALPPKEATIIGIHPLPLLQPGQRTVYVVHPFMKVDDVRPMGDILKQEKKHVVVLYVSAIRFADGTQWVMRPPAD